VDERTHNRQFLIFGIAMVIVGAMALMDTAFERSTLEVVCAWIVGVVAPLLGISMIVGYIRTAVAARATKEKRR
jgi:uncharacterized membrane protein HdeD (DUF308 family)